MKTGNVIALSLTAALIGKCEVYDRIIDYPNAAANATSALQAQRADVCPNGGDHDVAGKTLRFECKDDEDMTFTIIYETGRELRFVINGDWTRTTEHSPGENKTKYCTVTGRQSYTDLDKFECWELTEEVRGMLAEFNRTKSK